MSERNPLVELAKRHVYEREQRVLRQQRLIAELELAGRHDAAHAARELLERLIELLDADKAHLELERRRDAERQRGINQPRTPE